MKNRCRRIVSALVLAAKATKDFFCDIARGKPAPDEDGFWTLYRAFRSRSLNRLDSAFNSFYLLLGRRVERSRQTVVRDRGKLAPHPLGWEEKEEIQKESAFWKGLYALATLLPYQLCRPFRFVKRLFSTRNTKDNLLRSFSDLTGFFRRRWDVLVPLAVAAGVFVYIISVANAPIVIGTKVNGRKLGPVTDPDTVQQAVEDVQDKASKVLGRSFKFPYEVSYYFCDEDDFLSQSQLYSSLINCLGEYISPGYGLYVDGKLVAALSSQQEIEKALGELVDEVQAENTVYTVGLFSQTQIAPDTFPTQKMMDRQHLKELLRYGSSDYSTLSKLDDVFSVAYGACSPLGLSFCSSIARDAYERARKAAEDLDFSNTFYYYEDPKADQELTQVLPVTFSYSKLVTTVGDLPFAVERIDDHALYEGGEEIGVKGKNGKAVVTSRLTYVNGKLLKEETVKEQVFVSPVTQVIHVGKKPLPEETVADSLKVFILPRQSRLNSGFGWRDLDEDGVKEDFHNGLDIEAPMYSNIYASLSGTVIFAQSHGTFGNLIRIRHDNGYETYYAHLDEFLVKEGDRVTQGQLIAYSGNTGKTTGPHFHFELRKPGGTPVNPLSYIHK